MGISPGNLAYSMPPAADDQVRKQRDLERQARENLASAPPGFETTVAALQEQIKAQINAQTKSNSNLGSAFTVTRTELTSLTFTVPAGYTKALVSATSVAMAFNSDTTTGDYLYCQTVINGVEGGELYAYAGPSLAVGVTAPYYAALVDLVGGNVLTVGARVRTNGHTWAASSANLVNLYAQVLFQK